MNPTETKTDGQPRLSTQTSYRIVVGSDFSELGDRAVVEALKLCEAHPHADLHVITVGSEAPAGVRMPGHEPRVLSLEDAREAARSRVESLVEQYLAAGHRLDMDKVAVYTTVGAAAERIVALAGAVEADVIVVGTHGRRGLQRFVLGSVAAEVVRRAPCGVFVIRPRDFARGEKVPEIQPPLQPGEHPLLPFRESPTWHYVHRLSRATSRVMPVS